MNSLNLVSILMLNTFLIIKPNFVIVKTYVADKLYLGMRFLNFVKHLILKMIIAVILAYYEVLRCLGYLNFQLFCIMWQVVAL